MEREKEKMKYLVINSHPYEGSFNVGAVKEISAAAAAKGHDVAEIDLIQDGFNPVMTAEDLHGWAKGVAVDPLVKKYQQAIEKADVVVFQFPIWWGELPAVLKGFCDKVLLPGWAYTMGADGSLIGALSPRKAIVITTMQSPLAYVNGVLHNPVENSFVKNTLQACGFEVTHYLQIDKISTGGKEWSEQQMENIKALID